MKKILYFVKINLLLSICLANNHYVDENAGFCEKTDDGVTCVNEQELRLTRLDGGQVILKSKCWRHCLLFFSLISRHAGVHTCMLFRNEFKTLNHGCVCLSFCLSHFVSLQQLEFHFIYNLQTS